MTANLPPLPKTDWLLHMPAQQYEREWTSSQEGYSSEDMQAYARAALAQAQRCVPAGPPFGSKRNAALALYRPPFKFLHGYIYDADGKMCADEGAMPEHVAARVRGWGCIGYMPDAEAVQDEVGQVIAEALTSFWIAASPQPQPVQPSTAIWPKARDVGRYGDMSPSAHMRVGLDNDNDAYLSVWDEHGGGCVEFCNGGGGGGSSLKTRLALIALMVAMEEDNAARPDKDWWARRAAGSAAPQPKD